MASRLRSHRDGLENALGFVAIRLSIVILCLGGLAPSTSNAQGIVGLVPVGDTPTERAVMTHLFARLGDRLTVATATTPVAKTDLDAVARKHPKPSFIVGLDARAQTIAVLRTRDDTLLVRQVPEATFRGSPFSAAMVAIELLELADDAPLAIAVPAEPLTRAPPPVVQTATAGWSLGLHVAAGGTFSWSADGDVAVWRPSVDVGVELRLSTIAIRLDARARPLGGTSTTIDQIRVDYRRNDFDLGAGVILGSGVYHFGLSVRAGTSYVTTEVFENGAPEGRDDRFVPWSGLRLGVERDLGLGFALSGAVDAAWVPQPPRFLVEGAPVLYERGLRVGFTVELAWGSP